MSLARGAADTPLKPPLKWAGGKRWLVPVLAALYAPYRRRRLVEPFCGGLAVALGLQPRRALLNCANPPVVNFYRELQRGLHMTTVMKNERGWYESLRERFNHLVTREEGESAEAAALFYYLNRTGFNGLCRFNRRGEFNVPFGRYASIRYQHDLRHYREALAGWQFQSGDFGAVRPGRNDFIYADPPYDVEFRQYAALGFEWRDQVRLVEWLKRHPGPVVLSNQATERVLALYAEAGFTLHVLDAPRMISCNGDRTPAREVLALRNLEPSAEALDQLTTAAKRKRT